MIARQQLLFDLHEPLPDPSGPTLLTVLNFSGGKQSSALLWMVLRGDIERPDNFVVLNADPGMENSDTYKYVEMMFGRCKEAGIEAKTVVGPNLYSDLVQLKASGRTRIDNPPYFVRHPNGRRGKLTQSCTKHYKIRPMDQEIRRILHARYGIHPQAGNIGVRVVHKWIGFTHDELMRVKRPAQAYVDFQYPLIDRGWAKVDVDEYFRRNSLPVPPRSVCNACFANDVDHYREMHANRPDDWAQAVAVDESVRDWSQVGVDLPVYVSPTLVPLADMAESGFDLDDDEDLSCHAGYCFL